ncbi:MAG: beta-lactamase family protein [Actinomycetota bacterium]|nr:beta-lactamase family protein [Actinomycetota bacterium]MDQ3648456.1 beta-lactamase family protein [Actinomycetota bacterium]
MILRRLAVLCALVLVAAFAAPAAAGPRQRADARLDAALKRIVQMRGGPPGVAALVQRGRHARLHRAGVAVIRRGRPRRIRRSDRMRIASVTKAYGGAIALQLVGRGALSLDAPVESSLPDLPSRWRGVTLRQLLGHTSGVPDYGTSPEFARQLEAEPRKRRSPRELVNFVADRPLEFPPGSRYEYSNTENIVVGLLIEAVTRRSFARALRDRIFRPLRLRRTRYPSGFLLRRPFVHGYLVDPPMAPDDVTTFASASVAGASGAIVSTPSEMNRFMRAYVRGKFFRRRARRQQLRFRPGSSVPRGPGSNGAGLAIFRYRTHCGTVYGHTGVYGLGGNTHFAAATRDGRRSATVSANTNLVMPVNAPEVRAFRRVMGRAVCAALVGRRR